MRPFVAAYSERPSSDIVVFLPAGNCRSLPVESIELLNEQLFNATKDIVSGLTWLGIGGEQTIPNHFPCMRTSIEESYGDTEIDWRFF